MKGIILSAIFLSAMFMVSGCSQGQIRNADGENDKIRIITTIYPLYEFAKEVAGDKAEVSLLVPAGSEPHDFEPKPSDIVRISNADIFLYTGDAMEPWVSDVLDGVNNKNLIVIYASKYSVVIPANPDSDEEGSYNPHIWLDFENDEKIVSAFAAVLSAMYPKNQDYFIGNADGYKQKLRNLDDGYISGLKNCRTRKFITNHDAFEYLGKRYNLEPIPIYGLSADNEPSPREIKQILDIAKENNLRFVYYESFVSPKISETIAKEIGAGVLILNPVESMTQQEIEEGETFISAMEKNLENLKIGLECE